MLIYKNDVVADYRTFFANTSFPPNGPSDEFLAENSAYKVNVWLPYDSLTEKLVPCAPYIQDDWAYTVEVQPKTQEEIDADTQAMGASVRAERNRKLYECDWTQGKDIPDEVSTPWAAYRQELRDVPSQEGFPYNVIWPTPPDAT
jgi:hypothetical protein